MRLTADVNQGFDTAFALIAVHAQKILAEGQYSINIEQDLKQLLAIMLFNRAIHNADDHERNFSPINRGA
jgi:serine/threonine protein kinase HipA of HipAB toxin-antitoxin module